jgi:MSHA biogenesis protein MshG
MKFDYTAQSSTGQITAGQLEAETANQAARQLLQQGLTPTGIKAARNNVNFNSNKIKGPKPKPIDVMLFSQQMASMLRAGVPILKALSASESGERNPMGPYAHSIRMDLQAGKPLSLALAAHPDCFDDYFVAMIRIGEETGSIETIFSKLHAHMDFQKHMREQVKTALRYPTIVVSVVLVALLIVNFFVIPAFAKVYLGFKAELPFFTKILIGTSQFILNFWPVVIGSAAGSAYGFRAWLATTHGRLSWDRFKLKIPVAGNIAHRATLARFCQSLSLALSAGLPISSAMGLVGETTDNAWLAKQIITIKSQLERGESLYKSCQSSNIFTSITLQMILVGEESGNLDAMLAEVAKLYQEQVEYDLKTISSQLEPFLLLFLGGLVLILALGIFLPIWNLSSAAFPTNK